MVQRGGHQIQFAEVLRSWGNILLLDAVKPMVPILPLLSISAISWKNSDEQMLFIQIHKKFLIHIYFSLIVVREDLKVSINVYRVSRIRMAWVFFREHNRLRTCHSEISTWAIFPPCDVDGLAKIERKIV